jgi:acetoin utilization deacetylase AcuC-like enzyme
LQGPDLIIISAGFDAHHRDPLAQINLVADDFDWATGEADGCRRAAMPDTGSSACSKAATT